MAVSTTGAMYKALTFDGESSRNYGVYITGEAVYNAPERDVEMVSIPGRNGSFALDNGRYQNIEVTYPAGIYADTASDFASAVSDFRNMLCSRTGYCRLTDEYHTDEYRMAIYKSGLEVSPLQLLSGEFNITFECKPQRFLTDGETEIKCGTVDVVNDTPDTEPYIFRSAPTYTDDYDAEVDTLVGGTVAWNQLCSNGNFASSTGWTGQAGTVAVSSNVATLTVTSAVNGVALRNAGTNGTSGHVYVMTAMVNPSKAGSAMFLLSNADTSSRLVALTASTWNSVGGMVKLSGSSGGFNIYCNRNTALSVNDTCQYKNVCIFDLTQMFGSTIADYVYSLETNTAGAGVSWFRNLFPNSYYAYNAGELMSVNASEHITRDSDNNIIGDYALDESLDLRGIPKLDDDNALYYDGDTYEHDGTVTRKYGVVDLGTLTWKLDGSKWGENLNKNIYYAAVPGALGKFQANGTTQICSKYIANQTLANTGAPEKSCRYGSSSTNINVYDTDLNGMTTAQVKAALSGVYLVYELATETTSTADAFTKIQYVEPDGTEQYVDYAYSQSTRDVEIPVGHSTLYGLSTDIMRNPTLYDASPLLMVEGYGNISFNGYSVDIENAVLGSVAVGSSGLTAKANSAGISYVDYDTNLYNTGDTLTIGGIKFNVQTRGIPSTSISSVTVITAPSTGTTTSISHMASGSAKYVNIALKYDGFSVASNSTQTISDFARYRISYVSGGVTYTETFDITLSIHYANDALGLSVTMQENVNGTNYSGASWSASYETTYAYSTKSILGHPTYIDCDLGEAYKMESDSVVDLNPYIDLGSDLPVLSPGNTTLTYDSTITELKVVPNWWKL